MDEPTVSKFYAELAHWWPVMSAPADYEEESDFYVRHLLAAGRPAAETLLELGSGGGNNASFMKHRFQSTTLVEPSPGMLDVSRRLNPDCRHEAGDMRSVRLGQQFDRVFIHDAVVYMTTPDDLRQAIETAYVHCRPGGAALFAPDYVKETFQPGTDCGGEDGDDGRGLRFLEWVYDPDPDDTVYSVEYAFLLRENGQMRVEHDHHREGLFAREEWLRIIRSAGFTEARAVPLEHSEVEPGVHEVFVCSRPLS
jgi:SAM-dependent methyltransferase